MRLRVLLLTLILFEIAACAADLWLGPWGRLHWEELFNARGGVFFACGHEEAAADLQYRTFCGGCTAEGLMAVPLFLRLGPTALVWKLVPLFFHLVILVAGAAVAALGVRPKRGTEAAIAFVALGIAAPGFARDLALTGWGNHAESPAFSFVAALLVAAGARTRLSALPLALAGGVAGLGFWYCHTSAFALPALALGALWVGRWQSPAFLVGAVAGAWPWWVYHRARPEALDYTFDWWGVFDLAPPSALWDWLFGPYLREGLWPVGEYGVPAGAATGWWALSWVLGLWGFAAATRSEAPRALRLFGPLSFAALLLAYFLRHDLWSNLPDIYADATFNLRYRVPLVPLLALGAALAVGQASGRARGLAWGAVVALAAFGLACRVGRWEHPRHHLEDLRVFQHAGWPDRTVPTGLPPERMARAQGRPADVEAALAWIGGHEDALPDCRVAHLSELGRRVGIGLDGELGARLEDWLPRALALVRDPTERHQLAEGLGRSLTLPEDKLVPDIGARLDRIAALDPALAVEVGAAAGRLVHPAWPVAEDPGALADLDPRLRTGVCEGRGRARVESLAGIRDWRSGGDPIPASSPADHAGSAGLCAADPAFWTGLGVGFARWEGCGSDTRARLQTEADPFADHALAGLDAACALLRMP